VGPHVDGDRIVLYHGRGDLEVCLPVKDPVEARSVRSRVLEGGQMLCSTFRNNINPSATFFRNLLGRENNG